MVSYVMLVFVLLFILLFFYFVPLGLWIQAVVSLGVGRITIIDLIRMRLRKIAPRLVVDGVINSHKSGLNNINPPMFSSKNASEVNIKLHTLAMEDAKNKAIALAKSTNATVGRAIDVNAVPISFQTRPTEVRMLSADSAVMNEQNYEVGEITHQLSMIATFELIY